jgi:LIVCS family branched-chain amino acid:cation transporter
MKSGGIPVQKKRVDILVIGFALFSMFFGAGNVIFPPYLGMEAGGEWFSGFLCYFIADIGLALLTIIAMLKNGSDSEGIMRPLGKTASTVLLTAVVLCIGPLLAIPRTAASTYEMSVLPLFSGVSPAAFSVIFFALILALCINESAVVDIVGKVLTPALLGGLLLLIAVGVFRPIGPIADAAKIGNVPASGIMSGYQTMDVLAALIFGTIILKSAESKGYTDRKSKNRVVLGAGIVASLGLLVVYLGLTYLGATVSTLFDNSVNRSALVLAIVESLLGQTGKIVFAIVVALACITTAVALVSSAADYFSSLTHGKLGYRALVVVMCVFSAVVSNVGLDQIVSIAAPILSIVYPPALVLIILSFFSARIKNVRIYRFAAAGALAVSILETAASLGVSMPWLAVLPLSSLGFGWAVPAAVCGAVGALIGRGETVDEKEIAEAELTADEI